MNEYQLKIISGLTAFIGLLLMHILVQAQEYDSDYLAYLDNDETVLKGEIISVQKYATSTRATIRIRENIDVLIFENISLEEGNSVEIQGYRDDDVFIAEKIITSIS
jgi:hypothetical protein